MFLFISSLVFFVAVSLTIVGLLNSWREYGPRLMAALAHEPMPPRGWEIEGRPSNVVRMPRRHVAPPSSRSILRAAA